MGTTERSREGFRPVAGSWTAPCLLAAALGLGTPAAIYGGNRGEFGFGLAQLTLGLLVATIAFWAVTAAAGRLLPRRLVGGWEAAVFALATLVWISSTLLVFDLGVLDGSPLAFGDSAVWVYPELAFDGAWLVLATFTFVRRPRLCRRIAGWLLVLVVGTWGVALIRDLPKWQSLRPSSAGELFAFHPRHNNLVLLLDTFQADILEETLERQPDIAAALDGFIFFPDTLGVAPTTAMTMPGLHTGIRYQPDWGVREYLRRGSARRSFLESLGRAGHDVSLVNPFGFCPRSGVYCANPERVVEAPLSSLAAETVQLLDLSVFRASPLALKSWVYGDGRWLLPRLAGRDRAGRLTRMSLEILERLALEASATSPRPTTKFIHLPTPHAPLVMSADCSYTETGRAIEREAFVDQGRCVLRAVVAVLDRLRALGIYDSSALVLMSDHGARLASRYVADEDESWSTLVGGANPMLLLKPPQRRGALSVSRRAAQISDVGTTLCSFVEGCVYKPGKTLLAPSSGLRRRRGYLHYEGWRHELWGSNEPIEGTLYEVVGPLWDRSSWYPIAASEVP